MSSVSGWVNVVALLSLCLGSPNDMDDPRWYYVNNGMPHNLSTWATAGGYASTLPDHNNDIILLGSAHNPTQRCVFNVQTERYTMCDENYTDARTWAGPHFCSTLNGIIYCNTHDYDIIAYDISLDSEYLGSVKNGSIDQDLKASCSYSMQYTQLT